MMPINLISFLFSVLLFSGRALTDFYGYQLGLEALPELVSLSAEGENQKYNAAKA